MSLENIIKNAMENKPLDMKEAFQEEMQTRIAAALEEKYKKAMKEEDDEDKDDDNEDEDEDDDDDDEDEK